MTAQGKYQAVAKGEPFGLSPLAISCLGPKSSGVISLRMVAGSCGFRRGSRLFFCMAVQCTPMRKVIRCVGEDERGPLAGLDGNGQCRGRLQPAPRPQNPSRPYASRLARMIAQLEFAGNAAALAAIGLNLGGRATSAVHGR